MSYELGIIGAGNMAEAIARGVIAAGVFKPAQIIAADVSPQRRELFTTQLGIQSTDDNATVARQARILLLSVKPQQMATALAGIGQAMSPDALAISIMAGISTAKIQAALGPATPWRVIRTMPNTPILVGQGVVAIAPGQHATPADLAVARQIFQAAATVIDVAEPQIDAVTALSGSGPAYFFFLVEQMVAAGIELGLSPQQSHTLATRTALGSAQMLVSSPDSPQELRRKVTSPNGTTHAAITHMEQNNFKPIVVDAIKAAHRRSKELGA